MAGDENGFKAVLGVAGWWGLVSVPWEWISNQFFKKIHIRFI
jgi:hypothetical protein